jgi:hypothetical protein
MLGKATQSQPLSHQIPVNANREFFDAQQGSSAREQGNRAADAPHGGEGEAAKKKRLGRRRSKALEGASPAPGDNRRSASPGEVARVPRRACRGRNLLTPSGPSSHEGVIRPPLHRVGIRWGHECGWTGSGCLRHKPLGVAAVRSPCVILPRPPPLCARSLRRI